MQNKERRGEGGCATNRECIFTMVHAFLSAVKVAMLMSLYIPFANRVRGSNYKLLTEFFPLGSMSQERSTWALNFHSSETAVDD